MKRSIAFLLVFTQCVLLQAQVYTDHLKFKLDSLLALEGENNPGGSIHIEQGNQLLYTHSFGVSNIESEIKFSPGTVSNMGAISKVFIAYSILILQEQGKLSIEDSLFKYLPRIKNSDIAKKVRIRHLLMHTSGFKDLPAAQGDSVFALTMTDEQNFDLVKYSNKLAFEPGSNNAYSDQAFSALVLILEKVSNQKWHEFIQQYIFAPSGMTFSKFSEGGIENTGVAHGYAHQKGSYTEYDQLECPKFYTATNAGVWSNIEDLRKFMYALKYCIFLKCETIKLSEQILLANNWYSPHPPIHGLCWFMDHSRLNGQDIYFDYSGQQGGYRSHIIYFPEKDLTIIWMSNNSHNYTPLILNQLKKFKFIK
jgi:CubicO group peptidase (beta-lactamase class C family)